MNRPRYPLVVQAMGGLGDGIYQRPFIRQLAMDYAEVFVVTPWPELYTDLPNVRPVRPQGMALRTQAKNIERYPAEFWAKRPMRAERIRPGYMLRKGPGSIIDELREHFPKTQNPFVFDLPDFGPPPMKFDGDPYAVVRPATIRGEWAAGHLRNPEPEYLAKAARALAKADYRVVSVADVTDPDERWDGRGVKHASEVFHGDPPPADETFHEGELHVDELLALVQGASVVVGGSGWIVPACVAMGVPAIIIGGGLGGHNAPEIVTDRRLDTSRIRFVLPDDYCRCTDWKASTRTGHECSKRITYFGRKFKAALEEVTEGLEAAA